MAPSHRAASSPHLFTKKEKRIKTQPLEAVLTLIQSEEQDVEAQAGQQGTQRCLPPTTQSTPVTKNEPGGEREMSQHR